MSEKNPNQKNTASTDFDPSMFGYLNTNGKKGPAVARDLPVMHKGEEITSLVFHILACLGGLATLAVGLYYGITNVYGTADNGGWSYGGIIAIIVLGVTMLFGTLFSFLYHHKAIEKPEHEKEKLLNTIGYYLVLGGIYTLFALIPLRTSIVKQYDISYDANVFGYLGILMLILVWIIVVAGIVANVVLPKKNPTLVRDINFGFGILGLWPIVCNYPILASEISMGKPAMWLVIFAPITLDIGMIFFGLGKKKPGMHTAWHVFAYLALAMEIVAVYYYSIALAQQIAQ